MPGAVASNPGIPTSYDALFTEELTMDPFTPLPSFLEMTMMEETAVSTRKTLQSAMESVSTALDRTTRATAQSVWQRTKQRCAMWLQQALDRYGPEMRFVILFWIEQRCLQSSASSTVAESIYGGRRAKLDSRTGALSEPSGRDKTRLALLLAVRSLLQERLQKLFDRWKDETPLSTQTAARSEAGTALSSSSTTTTTTRRTSPDTTSGQGQFERPPQRRSKLKQFRSMFVMAYPYLCMTNGGILVVYRLLFMFQRSGFFDPWSHLLGLVVRRVTMADSTPSPSTLPSSSSSSSSTSLSPPSSSTPSLSSPPSTRLPFERTARFRRIVAGTISSLLAFGWYLQLQKRRKELREDNEPPQHPPYPPPPSLKMDPKQRLRPHLPDPTCCPLCRQQPRIRPVAAPSGYVFCNRCLTLYVRQHGKCPLTGVDCPETSIVRLYETNQ